MQLKKIMAVGAAVAISLGTRAGTSEEVSSSNEFGLLKLHNSGHRIILGVPWCACSNENDKAIMIKDLVSTVNLDDGAQLSLYDEDGNFRTWRFSGGEWHSEVNVNKSGEYDESDPEYTVPRGRGLILWNYNNSGAKPFYLHGQVASESAVSSGTIKEGTKESPVYTLVACPNDEAWKPNVNLVFTGESNPSDYDGDELVGLKDDGYQSSPLYWVANQQSIKKLKKKGTFVEGKIGWYSLQTTTEVKPGFGEVTKQELVYDDTAVDAGKGFWYVSRSNHSRSFSWTKTPITE